jgi:1-acyl-sn-glycerol-3-phosphate acyltransferase
LTAFGQGRDVLVFPGGDREAAKPWVQRNQVQFHGRTGFAALALEAGVPIVPIVTAGAGNTLLVLSNGERLAKMLRLDRSIRSSVLPISIAIPWGLNFGVAAMMPYLGLPARLHTDVLAAISPDDGDDASDLAKRVHTSMQRSLDRMTQAHGGCGARSG